MANRFGALALTTLSLTALGFCALPVCAVAQAADQGADTSSNDQLNKPINLDVRSANLYYALTLMFDQLKVGNYTIPEQLKTMEVSAHFTQLPLRTALETLLKNSGYTYKVDGGVYSVVPKAEEKIETPLDTGKSDLENLTIKGKKIYRLTSNQILFNSVDIVTRIGGHVLPSSVGAQMSGGGGGLGGGGLGGGGLGGGMGGFGGGGLGGGLGGGVGGFGGGMGGGGFGGGSGGGFGGGGRGGGGNRGGGGF